ncbi:outer membrane beta-barrel protein [Vibrio aphrogenes]|uniref:outer membrane beta-barrel protein n=1 Tax=Vibrio aphrogenes TaxID=1891186 RepID=UPI000B358532|nr:outer membrane beta-barrel protein [Vibrio aphrogenes]
MRLFKFTLITNALLFQASFAFANPAIHQASEFYAGGKVGAAKFSSPCGEQHESCSDETGIAAGLYGGYQVLDWLAIEGGYIYLGGPSATYPTMEQPTSLVDYSSTVQGLELGLKADYALSKQLLVFGKGGALYWNVNTDADEPSAKDMDDSGFSPMLGGGLEYRLSQHLSARMEYQYFYDVGDSKTTGSSDVHFLGFGLDYRFGGTTPLQNTILPIVEKETQPSEKKVETSQPVIIKQQVQILRDWSGFDSKSSGFGSNSTELSPVMKTELAATIQRLQRYPQATVEVIGHTDSVGRATYNQQLSEARAQRVADYLMSQGIERDRITVKGYGEFRPIASNDTAQGRAFNRRVEIISPEVIQQPITSEFQ